MPEPKSMNGSEAKSHMATVSATATMVAIGVASSLIVVVYICNAGLYVKCSTRVWASAQKALGCV